MVSLKEVDEQLKRAGCNFQLWGRAEVRELSNVLIDREQIKECLNGHYEGGFALLCATNQRILLVDRKPMFLTVEDVRYDMIAEIDYSHRLLDSTVRIFTPTKSLVFTSWNRTHLRKLVMEAQQHVMAIRQYQQQLNSIQNEHLQAHVQDQLPYEPRPELTPMTMPNPLDQMVSPAIPSPTISMTPAVTQASPIGQPIVPFNTAMNPFLRTPLITRHRSNWR